MNPPSIQPRLLRLVPVIFFAVFSSSASADSMFDEELLKARGLGSSIAEYFRHASRFLPGEQPVDVVVNGVRVGKRDALFDSNGDLCFSRSFTRSTGLVDIDDALLEVNPDRKCPDYRVMSPRAIISLKPAAALVDITVPSEHVVRTSRADRFESGGVGAMLNYRAYAMQSKHGSGTTNSSKYLDLQAGLNVDDWIIRSKQSLSVNNQIERWNWGGAYVMKSFASERKTLQFGRISVQDPIFGGLPINGAQWVPERAARMQYSHPVTGLASARSTVEIRQTGTLLLKTIVPPGPFSLTDYPLQNTSVDLQVTVTSDVGSTHAFTVPAALLMQSVREQAVDGLHLSVGKIWNASGSRNYTSPFVLTASSGWSYDLLSGASGAMVSPGYLSLGSQVNLAFGKQPQRHSMFVRATTTHDLRRDAHGVLGGTGITSQISESFSAGASLNVRAGQYQVVQQASARDLPLGKSPGTNVQMGLSGTWNTAWFGGITGNFTQDKSALGDIVQTYSMGWSGNWRRASMSMGLSQASVRSAGGASAKQRGNAYFYANLSVPLGRLGTTRGHVRHRGDSGQAGASFSTQLEQYASLTASTERSFGNSDSVSSSASISSVPRYTSVEMGLSRTASGGTFHGSANGSIIATRSGVALSPQSAQDSFGIASTGDVMGVRINTPGGSVWSGPGGLAALPSYHAYSESRIEVATKSVGLDVDIDHGLWGVKAARGAVVNLDMGVRKLRRVVFTVTRADGSLLPAGSVITNGDGEMIATSLSRGKVLISNLKDEVTYFADDAANNRCRLEQLVFIGKKEGQLFDSGTAVCVPLDGKPVQEAAEKPKDAGQDLI